jgi:transposase
MLSLSLPLEIFLCVEPTDMRCGFDRLAQCAQAHAQRDVLQGGLFVFVNRRRNRLKLLYFDGDGLAVWFKRLEAGSVQLPAVDPSATSIALSDTQLVMMLRGIDLASVRQRKRYRQLA